MQLHAHVCGVSAVCTVCAVCELCVSVCLFVGCMYELYVCCL